MVTYGALCKIQECTQIECYVESALDQSCTGRAFMTSGVYRIMFMLITSILALISVLFQFLLAFIFHFVSSKTIVSGFLLFQQKLEQFNHVITDSSGALCGERGGGSAISSVSHLSKQLSHRDKLDC